MGHELVGDVIRVLVAVDSPIYTQLLVEALKRDRVLDVFTAESESVVAIANAPNVNVLVISSTRPACSWARSAATTSPWMRSQTACTSARRRW